MSLLTAEAIWDHVAILPDELPFASGDSITILDYSSHPELWYGSCGESTGWFPSSYVRLINGTAPERSNSLPSFPQSLRHLRKQIIEELMSTERDYVHLLQDLVEGFVFQTRKRIEMFSSDCIQRLFANIEAIRTFHCKFLRELELSLNQNLLEDSYIGAVFLRNVQYCNNRPISCAELLALNEKPHYHQFFEACRLLRGMPKLSLEGFLLTPVQRICRYPLQLAELLKATPVSHVDREPVQAATTAMKNIAAMINEKKRRLEGLQKIALWQKNVDGWRGPDLFETNSRMIRSGEVSCRCIINAEIVWHKDVLLFLFDQSIVICKKDLIRRHHYLFKDRLSLIKAKLIDCTDGRDSHLGITLKNAWKLITMGKELIFSCKDKNDKREWIEQILKRVECSPPTAEERRLVHAKSEMAPLYLKTSGRFSWKKNKN
ncbi:unnamed protein product [Dracunculus medinensis]|uniref:DH domain-containing protein n=1 Tax=Dracunculus medinensis TaxID=318479 RepID=A0A0N4UBD3_DRAME|nr:unnamed protein product [Dracunculus medinensis]